MGFVIKKIVVHSEPTRVRGGEAHYNMVREKWDVRTLLEVMLCHCNYCNCNCNCNYYKVKRSMYIIALFMYTLEVGISA
jgi:hypothetical protein